MYLPVVMELESWPLPLATSFHQWQWPFLLLFLHTGGKKACACHCIYVEKVRDHVHVIGSLPKPLCRFKWLNSDVRLLWQALYHLLTPRQPLKFTSNSWLRRWDELYGKAMSCLKCPFRQLSLPKLSSTSICLTTLVTLQESAPCPVLPPSWLLN